MNILITGGAGFIGSHTIIELLAAGHTVVAVDNFSNSSPAVFDRLKQITGQDIPFYKLDVCNHDALAALCADNHFDAVIHFAGLKAVGESVARPLDYYQNNIDSTIALIRVAQKYGIEQIVFSSTAALYGQPKRVPVDEKAPIHPTNPYSHSKGMCEQILRDAAFIDPKLAITLLRYFNPVGAHPSGLIGEDPNGPPNNLMPFITQVAVGVRPELQVFGNDYDTPDGTGIRDYIHVVDIAKGHVAALAETTNPGTRLYNLGAGVGYSVLEVVDAFEKACGKKIPYKIVERRPGDIASYYADTTKAEQDLGWRASQTLDHMCRDAWNWQSHNPRGYAS